MIDHSTQTPTLATQSAPADPGQKLLSWRSHPVRKGGWRLAFVIAMLVLVPVGLAVLYGPFYGILALAILGGALGAYFLPTDYVFYVGGLETRFLGVTRRFTWQQFRSHVDDRNGVLLSPFEGSSRLENFRGIFLRYDQNRDAVLDIVRRHVNAPVKP